MASLRGDIDHLGPVETARIAFWALALAVIAGFAFFFVLGGFSLGDVVPVAIFIGLLCALWIVHAVLEHRRADAEQSSALRRIRERRGF